MERRNSALLVGALALALFAAAVGPAAYGAASTVEIAAIAVGGVSTRVLTNPQGMTLYYLDTDTPTRSTCTGGCASIWPPLLSAAAPTTAASLPGKLAVVQTANGPQVSYNGHLLYIYSGDTAPHQANGQGLAGKWWVAKVDLKPGSGSAAGSPAQPSAPSKYDKGGGY
jgi:predicted lipoprotein with Yx(FWY)xxD motif